MSETRHEITVTVNGRRYRRHVPARLLLADFLRYDLELTGTHVGCEHGVCGACTVRIGGATQRACLIFAVQADGLEIQTVEGVAAPGRLHAVQQAFHEQHGLQCGFCTPGMLMTALELLEENPAPSPEEVRLAIAGVLCRCTGYEQIVRAVLAAAEKIRESAAAEAHNLPAGPPPVR